MTLPAGKPAFRADGITTLASMPATVPIPAGWTTATLPQSFDLRMVLQRLLDQETLLVGDGGRDGHRFCAWAQPAIAITEAADLPACPGFVTASPPESTVGWPPFCGGAIVQLDYELPVGSWALDDGQRPTRGHCWPLRSWIQWQSDGQAVLVACDAEERAARLHDLETPPRPLPTLAPVDLQPAWEREDHRRRVEAIRDSIARGDCYQANLTLPFQRPGPMEEGCDARIFLDLITQSPAPYACLLRHAGRSVISHSPECFLRARGERCWSLPIKGTRRRQPGDDDVALRHELQTASKDAAELAMIVDLVRNDLGRVATGGGVRVAGKPQIMELPYVLHAYADIEATLRPGIGLAELLAASYPAGSITGAPKIASMRLLQELECGPRGPYCGTFGWYAHDADQPLQADLAVAIRTMTATADGLTLHAGGGIVADSDGDAEWAEVLAKAAPMAAAAQGRLPC